MASDKSKKTVESVRERAERAIQDASKPAKVKDESSDKKSQKSKRKLSFRKKKEEKKPRRFHLTPKYLRQSFSEIRGVTWPNRKDTFKLTTAVILFSIVFSGLVGGVDYVFSIIFKRVFLHG